MRMRQCNWLNCRELIPYDQKFCSLHQTANDKQRQRYLQEMKDSIKGTRRERHDNQVAQQKYDAEVRDKDAVSFYHNKRWVKLSHYIKVKQGYTSEVSGKVLSDNDCNVDHVVKRSLLPKEQWYDQDNLWLLSRREHQLKTAIEAKMIRDGKSNVLRHLSKEWWKKVIQEKLNE